MRHILGIIAVGLKSRAELVFGFFFLLRLARIGKKIGKLTEYIVIFVVGRNVCAVRHIFIISSLRLG